MEIIGKMENVYFAEKDFTETIRSHSQNKNKLFLKIYNLKGKNCTAYLTLFLIFLQNVFSQ